MQGRRNIGLLAGTFDPIHRGHVMLAEAALEQGLGEVWFIVDPKRESSKGEQKNTTATFEQRLEMVRLELDSLPNMTLYEGQWLGRSHTSNMFLALINSDPLADYALIMGADTFERLPKWDGVKSVVDRSTIMVGKRANSQYVSTRALPSEHASTFEGNSTYWLELAISTGLSSTAIRQELKTDQQSAKLSPAVSSYIKQQRLYL